ncbi:MAG: DUF3320 domain-containing protein [Planctomycetes bacterium]|nr:DUF3320 domain-containing protein [Planctomycetota bacterium]
MRESLSPTATLRAVLRLLLARRLELRWAAVRAAIEKKHASELALLRPEERGQRISELARAASDSSPRREDSFERIRRLPAAALGEECVSFVEGFSGPAGARLRDPATAAVIRRLAEEGRLGAALDALRTLRLDPAAMDDGAFESLLRSAFDSLSAAHPSEELTAAWREFTGAARDAAKPGAEEGKCPELDLHVEFARTVSWAMERNGVPIVKLLRIRNLTEAPLENLVVSLQVAPDFSRRTELIVPTLPAKDEWSVDAPDVSLENARLRGVHERERASLQVEIRNGERPLLRQTLPVEVLAFNEWSGAVLPDLLASFVMPNEPAVQEVLKSAGECLQAATGDPSLDGYQSRSKDRVRRIASAIYLAVQRLGVTYVNPPASYEKAGQKVRFPADVVQYRMGTCLDLSLLLAAALEQTGLRPVLVLQRGHAFPGVWLLDTWLDVTVTDDADVFRKLVEAEEVLLFDSSSVAARPERPFEEAEALGRRKIGDKPAFELAVDVHAARLAKFLPLSLSLAAEPAGPTPPPGPVPNPPAPPEADPEIQKHVRTRIDTWKEKLLDISLRNRLLNFRESKDRTVTLAVPEIEPLTNAVLSRRTFKLKPKVEESTQQRELELLDARGAETEARRLRLEHLQGGRILTAHPAPELASRLTSLFRHARTEVEETGASTLQLAVGMLKWFESETSQLARFAPILLLPVELKRGLKDISVRLRDDEIRVNETLLEKLRRDFGVDVLGGVQAPAEEGDRFVKEVLGVMRAAVALLKRFEVLPQAHMAFFSFSKYLLWRDLDEHTESLLASSLAGWLATGQRRGEDGADFLDPRRLDSELPAQKTRLVLDADSSQHVAVEAAVRGKTFVLQGPPGTGKSQTIANIIAECLAAGKRVLFVAEKRAALDVVARRLRRVGLMDFCLELHSNKANKREVVAELERVLRLRQAAGGGDADSLGQRVGEDARLLNAYEECLHRPTPLGLTHFQAVARLVALKSAPEIRIEFPKVLETTQAMHAGRFEVLKGLADAAGGVEGLVAHPLSPCRVTEFSPIASRNIEEALTQMIGAAERLLAAQAAAAAPIAMPPDLPVAAQLALAAFLDLLAEGIPAGFPELRRRPDALEAWKRLDALNALFRERDALLQDQDRTFERTLFELDLKELQEAFLTWGTSWAPIRWWKLRRHWAAIRRCLKGPEPGVREMLAHLRHAVRVAALSRELDREQPFVAETLGAAARGAETDPATVRGLTDFAARWQVAENAWARLGQKVFALPAAPAEWKRLAEDLRAAVDGYRKSFAAVAAGLAVDVSMAFGIREGDPLPASARENALRWRMALPALRHWARFVAAENKVRSAGLAPLCEAVRRGTLIPESLAPGYERAFLRAWTEQSLETQPPLRTFHGRTHDSIVADFRKSDAEFIGANGAAVSARLAQNLPHAGGGDAPEDSEVGTLQREALKQRSHMAIRKLLQKIPNLLDRLKPCLLMSPLSIAQYLPPSGSNFDLVVFDEASQIPTHDAIGAIARGSRAIVVGDSKQLPPTTFFEKVAGHDEHDDEESGEEVTQDLQSILDECVASGVPDLMLRWHYRSRDERLIAFSNHHYYDGGLHTFPASLLEGRNLGVHFRKLAGVFERGKSRTNPVEADAVAEWVVEALLDPERRTHSIGVVTFNQPQQMLIEDKLDEARRRHPEIDKFFSADAPEPVFVKNLENVQGDERDLILFSTTYGLDAEGRFTMNFGPLNKLGGERRLNVAITRAREQLVVFTSMRDDAIDLSRTSALGVKHLKAFLHYAEVGPRALRQFAAPVEGGEAESPFEEHVGDRLEAAGHAVDRQVGCSGYRIDLAVKDPASPGRYVLGIECDGASYHSAATARDRDRLRQSVLEDLGWRMHRIWSTDWFHDADEEFRRLEAAIRLATTDGPPAPRPGANSESSTPEKAEDDSLELEEPPQPPPTLPVLPPYSSFATRQVGSKRDLAHSRTAPSLVVEIVTHEGPVHRDILAERLAACYGIDRLSRGVSEMIDRHIKSASDRKAIRFKGSFAWCTFSNSDTPTVARGPASDGDERKPEHIAPEEWASALLIVLKRAISVDAEDCIREAARLFGLDRLTDRVKSAGMPGIDCLLKTKACEMRDGKVVLAI